MSFKSAEAHELITSTREDARRYLTDRQWAWLQTYLSFEPDAPSDAQVGVKLGISRAASSRMKWRILSALKPAYKKYLEECHFDEQLEDLARINDQIINSCPEFLEKERGKPGLQYWKAEFVYDERIGLFRHTYSKQQGQRLAPDLPIRTVTLVKESTLSKWWHRRIKKYANQQHVSYGDAYCELQDRYLQMWPEAFRDESRHLCRYCSQLLPLGELVEGRKVTIRRRYCSSLCKTSFKRKNSS
jgi:hypothetical protein